MTSFAEKTTNVFFTGRKKVGGYIQPRRKKVLGFAQTLRILPRARVKKKPKLKYKYVYKRVRRRRK